MKKTIVLGVFIILIIFASVSFAQQQKEGKLQAKITVPFSYSIVRGDVPIYGIASGKDFKEYRLEYGQGENPDKWILIKTSDKPQTEPKGQYNVDLALAKTGPGNLGLWKTGLSEYPYEEASEENKADLSMGIYTLKLTVTNKKGKSVEDKVQVEVGRVLLNAFSGKIPSTDEKAVFSIPEHSLYKGAEIITLKPLNEKSVPIPKNITLASAIYELNPPGLKFTQRATLQIQYDSKNIFNNRYLGIFIFNPSTNKWKYLETFLDKEKNVIETSFSTVPEKFALYAVFETKDIENRIKQEEKENKSQDTGNILCKDTFEDGFGQWQNKHGEVGATLELDETQHKNNKKCLKLINKNGRGNFASIVRNQPFDAQKYSSVSFDYKIPKEIKINFLVKVDNKWYDIVLSDEEKIYWEINMEEIGKIPNVQQDNDWHYVEFNLYDMLKGHTKNFIVEEMEMANWDCTGLSRLEFGQNPKDACYYIDNFVIKKEKNNL